MGHDFDCFGRLVFDDRVMKATLSGEVYQKLRRTIDEGSELEPAVADAVAARATKRGCKKSPITKSEKSGKTASHFSLKKEMAAPYRKQPNGGIM